jgi:hypothetical protein
MQEPADTSYLPDRTATAVRTPSGYYTYRAANGLTNDAPLLHLLETKLRSTGNSNAAKWWAASCFVRGELSDSEPRDGLLWRKCFRESSRQLQTTKQPPPPPKGRCCNLKKATTDSVRASSKFIIPNSVSTFNDNKFVKGKIWVSYPLNEEHGAVHS